MNRRISSTAPGRSSGPGSELGQLAGVQQQAVDALGDLVGGGLEPADQHGEREVHQLGLGQGVAPVAHRDELPEEVVGRPGPPVGDQRCEVVEQVPVRGGDLVGAVAAWS